MIMRISEHGRELIKQFEGLRLEAYQCSAGVWTIGYGHTLGVKEGMTISNDMAERLLDTDIGRITPVINAYINVEITQSMFDALCSFVFNIGTGAFVKSTMLRLINKRKFEKAYLEFHRWVYANGAVSQGLVNRRKIERELFARDGY